MESSNNTSDKQPSQEQQNLSDLDVRGLGKDMNNRDRAILWTAFILSCLNVALVAGLLIERLT
jgi:hypothetical protein